MARSESLDSWVQKRALRNQQGIRSDIAANIERAASLHERAIHELQATLKTELAVGITHAQIAMRSSNSRKTAQYTAMARQAYDAIIRLSARIQSEQSTPDLDRLKLALRKLGEKL